MDASDQMLLPVGFPSFDSFNPPSSVAVVELLSKTQDNMNTAAPLGQADHTPMCSSGEFDHIIKEEAMMTFAPEFGAVETPTNEISTLFKSPYLPKSRKAESLNSSSNNYLYCAAAPPSSPGIDGSDGKNGTVINPKACSGKQDTFMGLQLKTYYTYMEGKKEVDDTRSNTCNDKNIGKSEGMVPPILSVAGSNSVVKSFHRKLTDATLEAEQFLLSAKTLLATDVACLLFQASMCRLRHVLLSYNILIPAGLGRSVGDTLMNQLPGDPGTTPDNISSKYEVKKKENIPIRIAGDIDGGMLDGHVNVPVGVWRTPTVGVSKVVKSSNSPSMDVASSFSHNSFNEEGILSYGQRQPLQELLDGVAFLVQQALSFVDLALDADCVDGPYGWLALQEQWRRGFCCGPSMVHAGCGGTLASSHSLDIAGVELVDPLSADVSSLNIFLRIASSGLYFYL